MNQALIGALGAALLVLGVSGIAWSDHDHGRGDDRRPRDAGATATQDRYRTECGGCHLAYPPALLSADGWDRIMGTLANHFGDDASLEPVVAADLRAYLRANAANRGLRAGPTASPAATADGPPPRITQTRYFLRKHDEVPTRLVRGNPKIGSFSNCQACHAGAAQGDFDEHRIDIPGMGRWED